MPKFKRPKLKRHQSHVNGPRYVRTLQRTQDDRDEQYSDLLSNLRQPSPDEKKRLCPPEPR